MKIKQQVKLNDLISLKLVGRKTLLFIKDKRFRQCMRLLLDIPLSKLQDYDEIESIDDLSKKYRNTDNYKEKSISPEEEFKGHYSNLQVWIENDYNTCLLHRNLAFPLLKELANQGDLKAKIRFKEELISRFLSGNRNILRYFVEQKYLEEFTKEELNTLFEEFNFSKLLKWEAKDRYSWLGPLLHLNIKCARSFFQGHIISMIKNEDWETFSFILDPNYKYQLQIFSKEELERIFQDFNYNSFLNYNRFRSKENLTPEYRISRNLEVLSSLASLRVVSAKELLGKKIKDVLSKGNANLISSVFARNYLKVFSEDEINSLLKDLKLNHIVKGGATISILRTLQDISRFNKLLVKPYMKDVIEKAFPYVSDYTLGKFLDMRLLEVFTEKEQVSIVSKLNFSSLKKKGIRPYLSLLRRLSPIIPSMYKEEVKSNFLNGNFGTIRFIIKQDYFYRHTKEELTEIMEEFDFNKIELSLFKKLLKLEIPIIAQKFQELRGTSTKLKSLKQEIIRKFENGDYNSLSKMFKKYDYGLGFKDKRLNDLIQEDFEEIFETVSKNENFKHNFERSLQNPHLPFSVPFKIIALNMETTKDSAKNIIKEQASKIFARGYPLNIIAFLARPEYSKVFSDVELKKVLSLKNKNLKSAVLEALNKDSTAPLPLAILKRLTENGDKEAEEYLQEHLLKLLFQWNSSVILFLNNDGFLSCLKSLSTEMQIYLALSPDIDYIHSLRVIDRLDSPKIEEMIDADVQEDFKRIINNLQSKEDVYIRDDDIDILRETLLSFGVDAFRGLIALYSRNSLALQLLAVECILKLYRDHKSIVKTDTKRKLSNFFSANFKPYYRYRHLDKVAGEKEYEEILAKYNTEYNEIKNLKE